MGYFIVNNHCNKIYGSRAIVSPRMRDYAVLLLAHKMGTSSNQVIGKYLIFAKNAFCMNHQIYLRTPHLVYPYHYSGLNLTKRLITLMWSMTLGYGFPTSINLRQGHHSAEMVMTFLNTSMTIRTTFNLKNGQPHFIHFIGNYNNSFAIRFSQLSINAPITLDIYDPIGENNSGGQQEWKDFFQYIKNIVDRANIRHKIITVKENEYLIKYVNICGSIIGYTQKEFIGQYDDENFAIINGLYIESE